MNLYKAGPPSLSVKILLRAKCLPFLLFIYT